MRWLWNYGLRWLGGRVWHQATQNVGAATEPAEPRVDDTNVPETACVVAVVCSSKKLFDAVADAMSRQRKVEGHGFMIGSGHLAGRPVVVARVTRDGTELVPMLTALADGHHPQFLLSAAEGESLSESIAIGDLVVADRVFGLTDDSLRLDVAALPLQGVHVGGVASNSSGGRTTLMESENAPLAADAWSWPVAVAAKEVGLPMLAVSLVLEPIAAERSKEVDAMKKQASIVGKAGVLTGMVWKKRSGIRELWNRQEAGWEASGRLVALVKHLAEAC